MKTLSESILDDIETSLKKGDKNIIDVYLSKIYNKWGDLPGTKESDALGRSLKIGDYVITIEAYTPLPGKIIDIVKGKALVSLVGDGTEYICDYGKDKGKMKILDSDYKSTFELLKIDDKILKQLYNLK